MESALLGRTGIKVPRLCLGGWQASGWASSDERAFVETVRRALEIGLNFIDTAEAYGSGRSESLIGEAIAGRRAEAVLATKFDHRNSSPAGIRKALEDSLRRLGTDYVDLYQQHWPPTSPPLEETLGELSKLKSEGKIRAIGVSNWSELEWAEIRDPAQVDSLQPCYSLLWRSIEPNVLPLCKKHGIAVLPYSPLCQGLLSGRFREGGKAPADSRTRNVRFGADGFERVRTVLEALGEIAGAYGKTPAQVALRWLLDTPGVTAPVVGASRPEQLAENAGALGWRLEQADYERLSQLSWPLSRSLQPHDTLWGWHPRGGKRK